MLGEDVEVVAIRVERRDVALRALLAVVAVVVVGAEVRDLVLTEDTLKAPCDRRPCGARVSDDAEHDRARHQRHNLRTTSDNRSKRSSPGGNQPLAAPRNRAVSGPESDRHAGLRQVEEPRTTLALKAAIAQANVPTRGRGYSPFCRLTSLVMKRPRFETERRL